MLNVDKADPDKEHQNASIKVVFCFENCSTFSNSKEMASALGLPKVRDLRRHDQRFHRCLDTILHRGELGYNSDLSRYYIAELGDDDHVRQVTTALRLMEAGFAGAYLYQSYLCTNFWEPLLDLASDLERVTIHRSTRNLNQLRLKQTLKHSLNKPSSAGLLKALSESDACIAKTLKAAANVLRSSVEDIKLGE